MNANKLRAEPEHRLSLDINDDYGMEESWKNLTAILSENIDDTINFFSTECTDEEFFWLPKYSLMYQKWYKTKNLFKLFALVCQK